MKIEQLYHTEGNHRLILVFSGWSCDASSLELQPVDGWDVTVAYDYSDLSFPRDVLKGYHTIYVIAWSLGIVAAQLCLRPEDNITAAIAVNGTLVPVDDNLGIPEDIYHGTHDALSPASLQKFRRRMAGSSAVYRRVFARECTETEIDGLKSQLKNFENAAAQMAYDSAQLPWKRVYVSNNDAIFPPENVKRAWCRHGVNIYTYGNAHYVDFNGIIRSTVHDIGRISRRFAAAMKTYDTHAHPQSRIAGLLLDAIRKYGDIAPGEWAEIGPGTGLFTFMYGPAFTPGSMHYVDISRVGPYEIAGNEEYSTMNAEEWIMDISCAFDCILSSCVFQWFENLPLFLKNCHNALRAGGVLAFSILTEGTMRELDALRPSPIDYHTEDELRRYLEPYFGDIRMESHEISIPFANARELLMHLKHTGVGGSGPSPGLRLSALGGVSALTYRAAVCVARKKQ